MNLQPSEFIARTQAPDNSPQRFAAYNMVPGTVVRLRNHIFVLVDVLKGPHRWVHAKTGCSLSHEQFAARMCGDAANLPVILFDPLEINTNKHTNTTSTVQTPPHKKQHGV